MSPENFRFDLDKFTAYWTEKNLKLKQFKIYIDGTPERITLNKIQIVLPASRIYATFEADFSEP